MSVSNINPESPSTDDDTAKKQRKAYSNATTRLREEHRDRFEELREEESNKLGIPYVRRLTETEKAEQKLAALLAEHPELRERIAPATAAE